MTNTKSAIWDLLGDEYRRESAKLSRHVVDRMAQKTKLKNRGVRSLLGFMFLNIPDFLLF